VNVEPLPNSLSTVIVPFILSITCFTIESPNGEPQDCRCTLILEGYGDVAKIHVQRRTVPNRRAALAGKRLTHFGSLRVIIHGRWLVLRIRKLRSAPVNERDPCLRLLLRSKSPTLKI
jgi:hypothetical protein